MVATKPKISFEECRRKRLEENKKRMEALNLPQLSQSLRNSSSPNSTPMKQSKPRTVEKQMVVVRRSSRVANMPAPVYREVVVDRVAVPRRIYKRRDPINLVYASAEAREYAIEKAEQLQSTLEPHYPTLGLPVHFCKTSLPKNDGVMTLVNEDGKEFPTIYLARKTGLSGGWKGFSVAHELTDGDAVVFQLIKPTAMKVVMRLYLRLESHFSCFQTFS
ncbi:B3 domain-containing protein At5g42700-like isoform X4 [Rhodamnia argentea]|uniref:B3 domain-containing protein At5g42700-like isoform X4 n=1 Tax=Rhodamnia argentea TaxID=178133 RepID=A0A8B8PZ01_9MYRT|nr:B3 domain-containing protein At5g42700-like isoform X4 [Rhodamnia argentea]